jgi:hypothetical protein
MVFDLPFGTVHVGFGKVDSDGTSTNDVGETVEQSVDMEWWPEVRINDLATNPDQIGIGFVQLGISSFLYRYVANEGNPVDINSWVTMYANTGSDFRIDIDPESEDQSTIWYDPVEKLNENQSPFDKTFFAPSHIDQPSHSPEKSGNFGVVGKTSLREIAGINAFCVFLGFEFKGRAYFTAGLRWSASFSYAHLLKPANTPAGPVSIARLSYSKTLVDFDQVWAERLRQATNLPRMQAAANVDVQRGRLTDLQAAAVLLHKDILAAQGV